MQPNKKSLFKPPPKTLVGKWFKELKTWWRNIPWVAARIQNKRMRGYKKLYMQQNSRQIRGGLLIEPTCNCGHYQPNGLIGLIDTSCRNCGGAKPQRIYR